VPIYHRYQQDPSLAAKQQASGEIWGRAARNVFASEIPKVKAYEGPLPPGERGIEFVTDVSPDPYSVPGSPTWSGPRDGVVVEDGFAKIHATITKNTELWPRPPE